MPRNDAASVFRSLRSDCDFDRRAMKKSVPATRQSTYAAHSANGQAGISGWRQKADEEGFIVVHPQGLNASWNGGDLCCGTSQRNGVDDEGFIRAMVAELQTAGCIDSKRIYATDDAGFVRLNIWLDQFWKG